MRNDPKPNSNDSFNLYARHVMWGSMIVLFVVLQLRAGGIYPVVFADEWAYSSYSRLQALSEAGVPSYLYLKLFRITNLCGDGFLECARALNNFFIILTIPLIYAIARRLCAQWAALAVALLSVAGPINSYAIYFMPEAMYFAGFWFLTLVVLTFGTHSTTRFALTQGLLLGLLSLVKIHALFILPSLVCYAIYREWRSGQRTWLRSGAISVVMTILSFAMTKFVFGYLFAGRAGLTIFGSLYGSQSGTIGKDKNLIELISTVLTNLNGHTIALALMFGLPLAVMLSTRIHRISAVRTTGTLLKQDIVVFSALVLIPLLIITAFFTASVAGTGPYENLGRLHMRYYNFALPLFYLLALTQLNIPSNLPRVSMVAAILVILVACYGVFRLLPNFSPAMVDAPELRGFTRDLKLYRLLAFAGIASTIAWVFSVRKATKFFLFGFLPLVVLISSWQLNAEVRTRQIPDEYDMAGQFAKRYLGPSVSQLAVVAPNPAGLLRTLFHIDHIQTQTLQLEIGSAIDIGALPPSVNWLLLIGDYDVPGTEGRRFSLGQYALLPIRQSYQINFNRTSWPGVLSQARGLSAAEDWGTWSIGPEVGLEFAAHLPKRFRLTIQAHAFAANEHEKFRVVIGDQERIFDLKSTPQNISFEFSLLTNERVIRIFVPHPTSPKSIGMNGDSRQLGVGLHQILITPSD